VNGGTVLIFWDVGFVGVLLRGDVGEGGDAKGFCVEGKVGQEGRVCRDGGRVKGGGGGVVEDGDAEGFGVAGGEGECAFVVGDTGDIGDIEGLVAS